MKRPLTGILMVAPHMRAQLMIEAEGAAITLADAQGVPVVGVSGPMFREDHAKILGAIEAALASDAPTFVLAIDSPGGEADFCFDCVRNARARIAASGKKCIVWVGAMAASAGFAWACVASEIHAAPEALVGNVGVIQMMTDVTVADKMKGIQSLAVTSGTRKADGNPFVGITDESVQATQSIVDGLAESFFALVAEARGMTPEAVAGLQGAALVAKTAGSLVDSTIARSDLLAGILQSKDENMTAAEMAAKLKAAADEGDEEAKEAIASLAEGVGPDDLSPEEEEAAALAKAKAAFDEEEKAKAKATFDEEEKAKAEAQAGADAAAAAATGTKPDNGAVLGALRAQLASQAADIKAMKDGAARDKLLASRPDLTEAARKTLATATLATVQATLACIPPAAPGALAAFTRGDPAAVAAVPADKLSPEDDAELDRQMGITPMRSGAIIRDGHRTVYGASVPKERS